MSSCPDCGNPITAGVESCHFCGRVFHQTFNLALKCPTRKKTIKKVTVFQRFLAGLIDTVYLLVPAALAIFFLDQPVSETSPMQFFAQGWFLFLIFGGLQLFLLGHDGQTVGKKAMKIAVVMHGTHDHPPVYRILFLRTIVPVIPLVLPILGLVLYGLNLVWMLGDEQRCLHDFIAGTDVVHE